MMVKNVLSSVNSDNNKPIYSFDILHQFLVKNSSLSVISSEELMEAQKNLASHPDNGSHLFSILGWFDLEGDRYAIVNIHNSAGSADLNLTQLLTERELQIATLIASGHSNKQAANQLRISEWTVSAHLRRIFIKLNVDSRAAMVYCCASHIQKFCHR
jgi:DNA-binding NarL/FixJ family response regulator